MSERSKKFADELDRLISDGDKLHMAIQYDCHKAAFKKQAEDTLGKAKAKEFLSTLPKFSEKYQTWYSEAQAIVKQALPDRLNDFISYYEYPKLRKNISFQNYMIRDYLQGLQITRYGGEIVTDGSAAIPEFVQQLNIVKAARETLASTLLDLKAVLQADLFDSEIESAEALAKGGYNRAAGAICGVIIEKHLRQTCENRGFSVKKKNPGISDLNQILRDHDVISVPQWRFVQHLADIRNICDHAKGREPTKDEIADLLAGTSKILKTVF